MLDSTVALIWLNGCAHIHRRCFGCSVNAVDSTIDYILQLQTDSPLTGCKMPYWDTEDRH